MNSNSDPTRIPKRLSGVLRMRKMFTRGPFIMSDAGRVRHSLSNEVTVSGNISGSEQVGVGLNKRI